MLCYVILLWLFLKRLSQEALQRRSQRERMVKIKVSKQRREADDIEWDSTVVYCMIEGHANIPLHVEFINLGEFIEMTILTKSHVR